MLISEVVLRTGLTKDTIRFYEKHGLISISRHDRRDNNYKEYSEEIVQKLFTIKRLKNYGFTLKEISELLDMMKINLATCNNVKEKISDKVQLLTENIDELIAIRNMLIVGVEKCESGCCPNDALQNCDLLVKN